MTKKETLPSERTSTNGARVLAIFIGAFGLILLGMVIFPFLAPFAWALIITVTMWPLFRWFQKKLHFPRVAAATITTIILALGLVLAVVPLSIKLVREASTALEHTTIDIPSIQEKLREVPVVGESLSSLLQQKTHPSQADATATLERAQPLALIVVSSLQALSHTFFVLGIAIFLSFFLFLHGEELTRQARGLVYRLGGPSVAQLLTTAYQSVLATVYGTIVTAVAQGILAGIGYVVAGAPVPILLAFASLILSLLPFGAPFIYVPVAAYLAFVADRWQAGLGLAIWGVAVVSVADNVLRPLFISRSGKMSIALIFIGLIGGVIAFGALGIFIGPTIIALARVVWVDLVPKWIPEAKAN